MSAVFDIFIALKQIAAPATHIVAIAHARVNTTGATLDIVVGRFAADGFTSHLPTLRIRAMSASPSACRFGGNADTHDSSLSHASSRAAETAAS